MSSRSKQQKVTDVEIITLLKEASDPFVTAKEVSEQLPITSQRANQRLANLEGDGIVDRKKCGSGQGWWLTN